MVEILIVEDDKNMQIYMDKLLKNQGYGIHLASNGKEALKILEYEHIDLIVLDIMMPEMDGYTLASELRENKWTTPILMVTAMQSIQDKVKGFVVGTDDYMTKPIDDVEFCLRIKALLRRSNIVQENKIQIGSVIADYDSLTVKRGSDIITLPPKEFYLLFKLMSYPNKIFTRLQLMDEIWGMSSDSYDNTVTVHVNRLRKKFKNYPDFEIITVKGLGYKLVYHED